MIRRAVFSLLVLCASWAGFAWATHEPSPFGPASLAEIRKHNEGRPFVLAFWATHCEPCQREMPMWREMSARYPGVPIVLVATDPPQSREHVRKFLARFDPGGVQRYWFADEFEERTRFAVDPKWRGELPRTYLFDAKHRATAQTGVLEAARVEAWLKENAGVR